MTELYWPLSAYIASLSDEFDVEYDPVSVHWFVDPAQPRTVRMVIGDAEKGFPWLVDRDRISDAVGYDSVDTEGFRSVKCAPDQSGTEHVLITLPAGNGTSLDFLFKLEELTDAADFVDDSVPWSWFQDGAA